MCNFDNSIDRLIPAAATVRQKTFMTGGWRGCALPRKPPQDGDRKCDRTGTASFGIAVAHLGGRRLMPSKQPFEAVLRDLNSSPIAVLQAHLEHSSGSFEEIKPVRHYSLVPICKRMYRRTFLMGWETAKVSRVPNTETCSDAPTVSTLQNVFNLNTHMGGVNILSTNNSTICLKRPFQIIAHLCHVLPHMNQSLRLFLGHPVNSLRSLPELAGSHSQGLRHWVP
jgi:hypothetical protein